jgi:hypothetical protein
MGRESLSDEGGMMRYSPYRPRRPSKDEAASKSMRRCEQPQSENGF